MESSSPCFLSMGWTPSVTFAEGLGRTVDWYLENRAWWEEIRSGEYTEYYERMYGARGAADEGGKP